MKMNLGVIRKRISDAKLVGFEPTELASGKSAPVSKNGAAKIGTVVPKIKTGK